MSKIVHLLSGGIDSVVLLYDLIKQGEIVHCLMIDYKQLHVQELTMAKLHCHRLGILFTVLEIPQLKGSTLTDGSGSVIVPNRNAIMLSLAVNVAVVADAEIITFAANKDDEEIFPDCRWPFMVALNKAVKEAGYSVEICAPYIGKTKAWIVNNGRNLGVNFSETWSCYRGGLNPCGECEACKKRALALNGGERVAL